MLKKIATVIILIGLISNLLISDSPAVRVKDIATVMGVRSNQLMGFGLVVGLKGTGDSNKSIFTQKAFTTLLTNLGMSRDSEAFKSRNVAAVMVTAELPAFVKPGQKIDVVVSSVGDASSLKGGTLVQTPLQGADNNVYVVSQGQVMINAKNSATGINNNDDIDTVGRVIAGGIVEKEVPVDLFQKSEMKIVINRPDFSTAVRLAESLDRGGFAGAQAVDASTVKVPLTVDDKDNIVAIISQLEDFLVIPDSVAKVIIDQKTGTIIIGENVRLSPVAVSFGTFDIRIGEATDQTEASVDLTAAETEGTDVSANTVEKTKIVQLEPGTSLSSLVTALNTLGATPKDMVAIVQALKSAGALTAEVEVI